jgi:hypothetical protein
MWKSPSLPRATKVWQHYSEGKVALEEFFDWQGIMHQISVCATVNKERKKEVLAYLLEVVHLKCLKVWMAKDR